MLLGMFIETFRPISSYSPRMYNALDLHSMTVFQITEAIKYITVLFSRQNCQNFRMKGKAQPNRNNMLTPIALYTLAYHAS